MLNTAQPQRGYSGADPNYALPIDDAEAANLYSQLGEAQGLKRDSMLDALEGWATQKLDQDFTQADAEHERIYTNLDKWWKQTGGEQVDEEVKYRTANRGFIASQFGQTVDEQIDLYPSYRDQWTLANFGKKDLSEAETFNLIKKSYETRQQAKEAHDLITGDVALALFDQINKGKPVDVPALMTKWKEDNAEILDALPEGWEAQTLKAAGQYYAETERMLRDHGPVLQNLYNAIQKATGRFVRDPAQEGAFGDRFANPNESDGMDEVIDQLTALPPDVRDRGYAAILMAAKREGLDEKSFSQMLGEGLGRIINPVRTMATFQQEMAAQERLRLLESEGPVYRDPLTGGLMGEAGGALMAQSGQEIRQGEPLSEEERATALEDARREVIRFDVVRELRDLADNRFDPVKSPSKNTVGKFVQDIALLGPQQMAYTAMAVIPIAGPLLTYTAVTADEYNQLRLQGWSAEQAKPLAAASGVGQTIIEVFGARLIFGQSKIFNKFAANLQARLMNPARFGTASSLGIRAGLVYGAENVTEGFQDVTTPAFQELFNDLGAEYPEVKWDEVWQQWRDSRLEVAAAVIVPVMAGHISTMYVERGLRGEQEWRRKYIYGPLGLSQDEIRNIEDGTTPEEKSQRFSQTLQNMPAERKQQIKDNAAAQAEQAMAAQQDPTKPTLEAQKDESGTTTYIVRDETGKEVYRAQDQAAAEEAYVQETAKSTAARFNAEKIELQKFTEWWLTADPKRASNEQRELRDTSQGNAQQKLEALQQTNNKQGIEELHRRIAQSPYAGTPYDQIQILGEASVEQVGEMVFKAIIALNPKTGNIRAAREEMHHTAVRMAVANGRANEQTMREWLDATERVFAEKGLGITLPRADMTDIVESMAVVQEAFENERISADVEMSLPQAFVDYIKRMIQVLAEVLKRGKAIREALDAGALPAEFEAFLVETTGVADQTAVDRARERTEQEVGAQQNYSIGVSSQQDTDYLAAVERGDMETAQRMVDEAARRAGYDIGPVWHGGADGFTVFDWNRIGEQGTTEGKGFYFSNDRDLAAGYADRHGGRLLRVYLRSGKPIDGKKQTITQSKWRQILRLVHVQSEQYDEGTSPLWNYADVGYEGLEKAINEAVANITETSESDVDAISGFINGGADPQITYDAIYKLTGMTGIVESEAWGRDGHTIQIATSANHVKLADPVTYDASGNVIPLSQRFDATTPNINYSIGVRFDEIAKEDPKHDGSRVGTAWQGKVKPTTQDTNDGVATVTPKELEKQMAMLTHFVDGVPLPKYITKFRNAEKRMRAFIDFQKGNLLALYDAFESLSADYVIRSTHWYDGARLLAEGIRDRYNLTVEQSSAIMAVFSPMKDWFQNVAMGQRFADVMANHKDTPVNKSEMGEAMDEMLNAAADANYVRKAFSLIEGKSITDLLADKSKEGRKLAAVAVRLMSTHVHGLTHDVLSPEGESLGIRKNLDGSNKKMVWQSYAFIEKAISIYEDGSLENISKTLGTEHKIRNFYNNIVAPTSPYGDATVDTHAVNAAVLYPMGGSAYLTTLNFGDAGVAGGGNSGLYWLFHEALREAASERGVMPRQMQSITWEAIRGLFTDVRKRDKNFVAAITKIWEDSTDANAARTQIIGLGITPPEWARVGGSDSGVEGGVGESAGQIADTAGSVRSGVRQGRQGGNQGAGVDNYSISTQSEIDRVQAAMDRLSRSPSERIAQYAALKERLAAALERNQPIMQAMRGDTLPQDFDRTRLLNDLGFLDYILKVLPPEVRGRVGGYTNLAAIAPVDVYKGDQKVSEAKNPAGAIISAWMREGLNIGQAQKKTELPEGYSTVANTTDERRDKTIANFLIDRLKKIDRELERYYKRDLMERIFDVLDKSRPKAGDSGVKRSTLGPETQKFADMVYRASLLDDEETAKRLAAIEGEITSIEAKDEGNESGDDGQKLLSQLSEEWTIVNTFGDLKSRPSETLAYGLEWLQGQLKAGREAWNIKETARIQENRERAAKVIAFLGKPTDIGRFKNKSALQRFLQATNAFDLDHKSFEQFAFWLFGDEVSAELSAKIQQANISEAKAELETTRTILAAMRQGAKAAGMTTGKALVMFKENQSNAVRKLEGRKVKDTKISIDLAKKIVRGLADRGSLSQADVQTLADELAALPRDTKKEFVTIKQVIFRGEEVRLTMSRAQAMQLWLTWQQTDAQEKMRRDGFTDDSFEDLDNLISDPFSQAILRVTQRIYGSGYALTNPIYARMFGMNMPMVRNYAPARYLSSKQVKDIGLDGTALTAGGQPSFAKSRVNHTAKLAPEDALVVLQSHLAQQSHWVAFAEVTREYRSLLANPDVREAIRQRLGGDVLSTADMWGDQMEQRGGKKGRDIALINNALGAVIGGQSVSLLGLNLKSIAMQTDNLMRFFLALNSRQIASALSDPAALMRNIRKVWKTDIVQTRLEGGATAETRFLFTRFVSMFRRGAKISELAMMPMNYVDSAGLSVSGAIVYQAAYKDAIDSGMDERSAEQAAKDAVEAMVFRYGQPVLMGQKSNIENSGGVFAKTFFLFMSDPRLKMAIISDAVRGLATGRGDWKDHVRRIVAIELMALVSHVLATGFRDLTSDDEDEDLWSMGGFARALLLAPFQGYFFLGSVSDLVLSRLTESKWFTPTQDPFIRTVNTGLRAMSNLEDAVAFDDPDALVKEWTDITRSIAFTPSLAAPAVILNLVRPLVQGWERMDDDE